MENGPKKTIKPSRLMRAQRRSMERRVLAALSRTARQIARDAKATVGEVLEALRSLAARGRVVERRGRFRAQQRRPPTKAPEPCRCGLCAACEADAAASELPPPIPDAFLEAASMIADQTGLPPEEVAEALRLGRSPTDLLEAFAPRRSSLPPKSATPPSAPRAIPPPPSGLRLVSARPSAAARPSNDSDPPPRSPIVKQSIQFPLRTQSENEYRRGNPIANAARTKKQREDVTLMLSELRMPPLHLVRQPIEVTMVRISNGTLDDDNLRGALKAVRDATAKWLGFKDDSDRRLVWKYEQQACPKGYQGVRIEIVDGLPGADDVRVKGPAPAELDTKRRTSGRKPGTRPHAPLPREQQAIAFEKAYAALPWDQPASDASTDDADLAVTEIKALENVLHPPTTIRVPAPLKVIASGSTIRLQDDGAVVLHRHRWRDDELGDCWLYLDTPPEAPPGPAPAHHRKAVAAAAE